MFLFSSKIQPCRIFILLFAVVLPLLANLTNCYGQRRPGEDPRLQYEKVAVRIPMRDGKLLYTHIHAPRDRSKKYPIMLKRTPYGIKPYNNQQIARLAPSLEMQRDGYIFVHQDVRGRWMSEGQFDNMRPNQSGNEADSGIDESSDTYDTIEWLLKNVYNHNGKVGMWGISYPGFYCAAALPNHHPALVAVSPQAPISDFFFDDFHHHGAFLLSYFTAMSTFGYQHTTPSQSKWYPEMNLPPNLDAWSFFMGLGTMENAGNLYHRDNFFWKQIADHPNYDEFWKRRNILPHLKNVTANVLTVGGWYDAEDLYGPLQVYRSLESKNPDMTNVLVMGPWSHGDWSWKSPYAKVGKIAYGRQISDFYQKEIELPFFRYYLKGKGQAPNYEAILFDTGARQWRRFYTWPPEPAEVTSLYLRDKGKLAGTPAKEKETESSSFVSDPANPVPYRARQDIKVRFTPRPYMSDDQRFAADREDVLVFQTDPLTEPVLVTGDIMAKLKVSTSATAADWVVKLIDVLPPNHPFIEGSDPSINFSEAQLMIRSEIIRGRFRNSYEKPKPFVPNEVTDINLPLQDVCHTFKAGHRIMIQIQSSWFPLIDRNPQTYVDNIFKAKPEDFVSATHKVFHSSQHSSSIELKVLTMKNKSKPSSNK